MEKNKLLPYEEQENDSIYAGIVVRDMQTLLNSPRNFEMKLILMLNNKKLLHNNFFGYSKNLKEHLRENNIDYTLVRDAELKLKVKKEKEERLRKLLKEFYKGREGI